MGTTDWDPPTDAALTSGEVGLSAQIIAIRDLATALAERSEGSPWFSAVGARSVHTVSGSFVVPAEVTRVKVTLVGGGGAGGAGRDSDNFDGEAAAGGGGGAGAYAVHSGLEVTPGETLTVTIGAGGAGGATTGGSGGATSVSTVVGAWVSVTAAGGSGGARGYVGDVSREGAGGIGGIATVLGDVLGGDGGVGFIGENGGMGGAGGGNPLGGGAQPSWSLASISTATGINAVVYGTGGSGGMGFDAAAMQTQNGGNGAAGIVVIEY